MARTLIVFALFLCGCPPSHVERPYPPPSAAQLLEALRARAGKLQSLRAQTKIDHLGEGGQRIKVKVGMLLERGGKLRLEAESPFGGALATLVSDGARFALLDVRHNRFLVGPARAC